MGVKDVFLVKMVERGEEENVEVTIYLQNM